jgi:hypothetical protein
VRHTLKTPYRDGTTHVVLDPLDLMGISGFEPLALQQGS